MPLSVDLSKLPKVAPTAREHCTMRATVIHCNTSR